MGQERVDHLHGIDIEGTRIEHEYASALDRAKAAEYTVEAIGKRRTGTRKS